MSNVTEHLRESRDALLDVVHNKALRRLNLAFAGSIIGDWAFVVGMSVFAFERGGAGTVGAIAVARYLSMAICGPFIAVAADRFDRRRVMIVSDAMRGALVVAAACVVLGHGPTGVVYVLYVATSLSGLAFRPAQAALLPSLANTPAELTAANVTSYTIHSVGFFAGPAIAGLLLAFTDVGWVFVFDAATFVWSATLVMGLHPSHEEPDEPKVDVAQKVRLFSGASVGYRTIFASEDLRRMMALYVAQTVVAGASAVFEVAVALKLLKLGKSGVGVLGVALGIGGIIGGMVALLLAQRGKLARDFGLGITLWAAPLLLIAIWPTVPSALLAMALIGLGNSVVDVNFETILQRLVPDAVMGRVFGAMDSAAVAGMAIGAALMPILIATVGIRTGLTIIGVAITVVVVLSIPRLVHIDRIALAPDGLDLMRSVPMLAVLPDHLIERLARTAKVVKVPAGASVFHEGDPGDRFYVIEAGTASVVTKGQAVATIGPGDAFGEIALLRDVPRTATITALTDLAMRAIDRRHFLPAVTGHAEASEQAELVVGRFLGST